MDKIKNFEGFPFNIGWELTLACNLRCSHCASAAGIARPDELTTQEALAICDQFPTLLVQEVDLTGGEPLLRPDWFTIALHLKNLGISVNILTNGLVITPALVAQMQAVGIKNAGISLDGLQETHDRIRHYHGSFAKVLSSIDLMQEQNIPVIVITTVNDLNIGQLPDLYNLLNAHGVKHWRLQPVIPIGRVLSFKELTLDNQGILTIGDFIQNRVMQSGKDKIRIICSDGLEYIPGTEDPDRPWRGCSAGWITCGITSDGKVKGCLSLPDEIIDGDLRQHDLWDIWFHPDAFYYTRQFSENRLGANCKECDKALECKGGCSSNSWAATGSFHNDPYCYYNLTHNTKVLQV